MNFVLPHYGSRIQMEEVTLTEWFPLRAPPVFSPACISYAVKTSFIMNLLQASSIMCLKFQAQDYFFMLVFDYCVPLSLEDDSVK